jgi:oxygen-dependent protoporphyrinogen oxidase
MEREHGSLIRAMFSRRQRPPRLVSFVAGMSTLTDALAAALGDAVRTRAAVRTLSRQAGVWHAELAGGESVTADRVVLATSAARAAEMTSRLDPELSRALAAFPFAGMAVVALAYRARDLPRPLDGYGYLVTRGESLDTMGVVWESSLFAGRAPAGMVLVRAMLGGTRRPDVVHLGEAELIRRARLELARVLGWGADPARAWVWTRPDAIAQYTVGHLARVARARERAAVHDGLELCGSSYDGISFGSAIQSAERAVTRLLRDARDGGQSGTERELMAEGVA